jgi:hypothetical protein
MKEDTPHVQNIQYSRIATGEFPHPMPVSTDLLPILPIS